MPVELTGYAFSSGVYPIYNCQIEGYCPGNNNNGDCNQSVPFSYKESALSGLGAIQTSRCDLTYDADPSNYMRFQGSLEPMWADMQFDAFTEDVTSADPDYPQSAKFIVSGGQSYVMNFGFSTVPGPYLDRSYYYITPERSQWMAELAAQFPGLTFRDLVLPGAHDAGMYVLNDYETVFALIEKMCIQKTYGFAAVLCAIGSTKLGSKAVSNLSLTQKDDITGQLRVGTRYFDLRPAIVSAEYQNNPQYSHVHNFVPGARLDEMLGQVSGFLLANPKELVVLRVQSNGIDTDYFSFIDKKTLETFLKKGIDAKVGYQFLDDLRTIADTKVADYVAGQPRVIVIYGAEVTSKPPGTVAAINDSYNDTLYQQSYADPGPVLQALGTAFPGCADAGNQYSVLQLQDTGSGALVPMLFTPAWLDVLDDLTTSLWTNMQLGTKPVFDAATLPFLLEPKQLGTLKSCLSPVVVLNDGVDGAMATHAIRLTQYRLDNPAK